MHSSGVCVRNLYQVCFCRKNYFHIEVKWPRTKFGFLVRDVIGMIIQTTYLHCKSWRLTCIEYDKIALNELYCFSFEFRIDKMLLEMVLQKLKNAVTGWHNEIHSFSMSSTVYNIRKIEWRCDRVFIRLNWISRFHVNQQPAFKNNLDSHNYLKRRDYSG